MAAQPRQSWSSCDLSGPDTPGPIRPLTPLPRQSLENCRNRLTPVDVALFRGLGSHRDRAIVLAMLLGGLRAGEVRRLLLADVDQGRRQLRVVGKGGRERVVPVDDAFFAELASYLSHQQQCPQSTAVIPCGYRRQRCDATGTDDADLISRSTRRTMQLMYLPKEAS
ncbi:tyrosine-type recombinase/integrase [Mycobacterium ulcerans]|nr:site-specific integrase [Mycobacterium ulcerans]